MKAALGINVVSLVSLQAAGNGMGGAGDKDADAICHLNKQL